MTRTTQKSYANIHKRILTARHHYELLGVHRGSTPEELSAARRDLAKHVHPDVNGMPDAHDLMARVNIAYTMLTTNPDGYLRTLHLRRCEACHGKGYTTKQRGFTKQTHTACAICHGAGLV